MVQATNTTTTTRFKTAARRRKGVPDALVALAATTGETKIAALREVAALREQAERTIERLMAFLDRTEPDADLEPPLGSYNVGFVAHDAEGDGLDAGEYDEAEQQEGCESEREAGAVAQDEIEAARERHQRGNERPANGSDCVPVIYSPMHSEGKAIALAMLRRHRKEVIRG